MQKADRAALDLDNHISPQQIVQLLAHVVAQHLLALGDVRSRDPASGKHLLLAERRRPFCNPLQDRINSLHYLFPHCLSHFAFWFKYIA
ncbi:hypothetical protein D3C71_1103460 [compost metagenome]